MKNQSYEIKCTLLRIRRISNNGINKYIDRNFWHLKKILLGSALLLFATSSFAQVEADRFSHKKYLNLLNHSKDSIYSIILSDYDRYILHHPAKYQVQLERCRFIRDAYYDYAEDYNPNYEKADACSKEVMERFPYVPEVLLFRTEFLYGDSSKAFLKKLEAKVRRDTAIWRNYAWEVYKDLAENYEGDSTDLAIFYSAKAMNENDTLDLTLMQAKIYKEKSNHRMAIEVLSRKLDGKQKTWELNQKGRLLLELGATDKAIQAFRMARKDSTGWQDSGSLAAALIENGLVSEAREYLRKEATRSVYNSKALYQLFDYDVKYGVADSAKADYEKLIEADFWNDPVGASRIRLLLKAPLAPIHFSDLLRLLLLLLFFVAILLAPYAWILPIHYVGGYFFKKQTELDTSSPWGLRHLWLAFSMWFFVEFVALLSFDYTTVISWFNESFASTDEALISEQRAIITLSFCSGIFLLTLFFAKQLDYRAFLSSIRSRTSDIWRGLGMAILLRIPLGIYLAILKWAGVAIGTGLIAFSAINEDIISINKYISPWIGFLFVVILVPFYEEILFRGIFLSACKKHLNFAIANTLQAFVFAAAHQNLKLFVFFFAFGLVAGYYKNKTGSFAINVSMHMTNNLIAFLAILRTNSLG